MPKKHKERWKVRKEAYLDGRARNPHRHTPALQLAFNKTFQFNGRSMPPVFSCAFKVSGQSMVHQGSELTRKKALKKGVETYD